MALMVDQTLPYTSSDLKLDDTKRWSRLLPLMRPSLEVVGASNGESIVVDTALTKSQDVLIAVVTNVGHFSSTILNESHVAAFATESSERLIKSNEILKALKTSGLPTENGVVVIRSGTTRGLSSSSVPGILEIVVDQDVEVNHLLSFLCRASPLVRCGPFLLSLHSKLTDLGYSLLSIRSQLQAFAESNRTTTAILEKESSEDKFRVVRNEHSSKGPSQTMECSSIKDAIAVDLNILLDGISPGNEVYSIHFSDVNGLSRLEINIITHEISERMAKENLKCHITHSSITIPDRPRGWTISMLNMGDSLPAHPKPTPTVAKTSKSSTPSLKLGTSSLTFSSPLIRKIITGGCNKVIASEPTITEYDTIVGDGDCGFTLRDGARQVLSFISIPSADLANLPTTLNSLVDDLEVNMGGTSGALYCIFLSSLAQSLVAAPTFSAGLKAALEHLLKYTCARLGDRTCLDCLIPFVESLEKGGDVKVALEEARKGVKGTEQMEAMVGRSSYLNESATRGVPDPGAYGLLMLLEGMVGAVNEE